MECILLSIVIFSLSQFTKGIPVLDSKLKDQSDVSLKTIEINYHDKISSLQRAVAVLEERVTRLETMKFEKELNKVKNKDNGLTDNHAISKRSIFRNIRRIRRAQVAFQATLTMSSATFNMLETIIFNNVITNIGHAYNKHTGVFIAPVAGTYTFNTNIVSERGHYVEASIVRNGEVVVSAISDHRIPEDGNYFTTWDQGNAVAILRLKKGDKVSVTLQWPEGSHAIHGIGKSSFSGCLLR